LQQPVVAGAKKQVKYHASVGIRGYFTSADTAVEHDGVLGSQRSDDLVLPRRRQIAIVLYLGDQADKHGSRAGTGNRPNPRTERGPQVAGEGARVRQALLHSELGEERVERQRPAR
jgi:hypothetical protein